MGKGGHGLLLRNAEMQSNVIIILDLPYLTIDYQLSWLYLKVCYGILASLLTYVVKNR